MELKEILIQDRFTILNERKTKDGDVINVLAPWTQAEKKNKNGRIYPLALLQREISRVQKDIEAGGFLGTADHPASGIADLETVSHIVKKLWLDKDGRGWTEMKILPTTKGKNLITVIREGGRLGVSSRGFGNVDTKTGVVQNDYKLAGVDIVINPASEGATFSKENVFESLSFETENKGINKEKTLKRAEIPQKVEPKDVIFEARIAGVSPTELARKINKNIEAKEKILTEEALEERKLLRSQMLEAGIRSEDIDKKIEDVKKLEEQNKVFKSELEILTEDEQKKKDKQAKISSIVNEVRLAGGTSEDVKRAVAKLNE